MKKEDFENKLKNSLFNRFCEEYNAGYVETLDGIGLWPKYDKEGKLDRSKTAIRMV